jgi:hypothetical protein
MRDCFGGNTGSASIVAAGGLSPYTFLWNTGASTSQITNLIAGSYTVTISDNNGCPHPNYCCCWRSIFYYCKHSGN